MAEELAHLDDAVAYYPDEPRSHNARAMRAMADRDFDRAVKGFQAAANLDPREPALRLNLATAYRGQGDDEGERSSLLAALDIDQRYFMAQLRLAELLQRQGRISEAAPHWSAVAQLAGGMQDPPPAMVEIRARAEGHLVEHNRALAALLDQNIGIGEGGNPAAHRFSAAVDHILGRRKIYHNECAGLHYPFLPADEFFDRSFFPWFAELEAKTGAIRAEALAMLTNRSEAIRPYVSQPAGAPENKWSPLDNNPDWSACFLWEFGRKNEAVCELCPETAAALAAVPQSHVPGKAPNAFFSILRPGAHIPPHTGVTNTRAIIHLPLVVPDGCTFRVGGETRHWREGEAFAFDDTIEHEARNDSNQRRVLLIFDVWNPHLTEAERANLERLFAIVDRGIVTTSAR
ncbi:aspartyl/asparaginyl beta-hydroxylase domain-containing protein [Sphingomonas sp.]|uniref:aspartyl/asparaginyl beta-hydroxylase domain-containing protein n=2 Tax=unclassified Sphingomonas TaxID=196159 RepID=UPI000A893527|nr:aspartyl/asparaginyl beta-hydroxylase domain-containing protein [Sphingomonas sp.]